MVLRVKIFVILLLVWSLVCVIFLALPLSWRSWVFGVFTSLPCSFSHLCNYLDWAHLCLVTPVVPQTFLGVFPHVSLVLRLISCYSWAVLFVTSKFSLKIFFSDLSVILSPIHKHVLTIVTKESALAFISLIASSLKVLLSQISCCRIWLQVKPADSFFFFCQWLQVRDTAQVAKL